MLRCLYTIWLLLLDNLISSNKYKVIFGFIYRLPWLGPCIFGGWLILIKNRNISFISIALLYFCIQILHIYLSVQFTKLVSQSWCIEMQVFCTLRTRTIFSDSLYNYLPLNNPDLHQTSQNCSRQLVPWLLYILEQM